jgi:hypothetical protein
MEPSQAPDPSQALDPSQAPNPSGARSFISVGSFKRRIFQALDLSQASDLFTGLDLSKALDIFTGLDSSHRRWIKSVGYFHRAG